MSRLVVALVLVLAGCGKDELYRACEVPEDCDAPEGATAVCLVKGDGGFCTWTCENHADCNDADDEDFNFQCAPFESNGARYCFPGCDGAEDDEDSCPDDMTCRSTGGGSANEKVCFPDA